jgi:addiction module RelE/StbE family toxin
VKTLRLTHSFEKEYRQLTKRNKNLSQKFSKQVELVIANLQHPSLRLHKLVGLSYWSLSIDKSVRVLLLIESDTITFCHIGTHDQVY